MKALVIDDDPDVLQIIDLAFRVGWPNATVVPCTTGYAGIELVETETLDVVLLDLMLPDMSGLEVLSQVRRFSNVPIIIVTVRVEEMERVRGLEMGADDYICKPFNYLELLARVRAVLRRGGSGEEIDSLANIDVGGLHIDFKAQEVILQGREVRLTPTEYRLLCQLVLNQGKAMSHKALIERVWGHEYLDTPSVLKVHIHRLRQKLCDTRRNALIVTVPRRGYKFSAPVAEASGGS